jgi:hypothetical protein
LVPAAIVYAWWLPNPARKRLLAASAIWCAAGLTFVALSTHNAARFASNIVSWGTFLPRMVAGSPRPVLAILEATLYPFSSNRLNDAYHVIALLLLTVGCAMLFWANRKSFLGLVGVMYAGLLVVTSNTSSRYDWPLFPVFATALIVASFALMRRVLPSRPRTAAVATGAVWVLVMLGALWRGLSAPVDVPPLFTADARALYAWLRAKNTAGDMRVAYENPRVLVLEAGVRAMGAVRRNAEGQLVAYAERRISHVITQADSVSTCAQRVANRLPARFPDRFALEFENATFRAYRVLPGAVPAAAEVQIIERNHRPAFCN